MILENILLVIALFASFGYMFLGLFVREHLRKDIGSNKAWSISSLWAFNPQIFDDVGEKACVVGKKVFWIGLVSSCLWILLKYS